MIRVLYLLLQMVRHVTFVLTNGSSSNKNNVFSCKVLKINNMLLEMWKTRGNFF